jgi:L-amino acid N-acyltransferase
MSERPRVKIGIREATDADLLSIVEIVNREIAESPYVWTDEPITVDVRRVWLRDHRESGMPVFVATDLEDDRVLGWASLSTFRPRNGYRFTAEVSVYVARDAHRRGVGKRLVETVHEAAAARRLRALIAVVDAGNAASVGLFQSLGYTQSGRLDQVGYKYGEWRSELFLQYLAGSDAARDAGHQTPVPHLPYG